MTRRTPSALTALLALVGATLAGPALPASAQMASDSIQVDDDCTVDIEAPGDNSQTAQDDVEEVKDTINNARDNSADMRAKLKDACESNGGSITIEVKRDTKDVLVGSELGGTVEIDPEDIEDARDHLDGKDQDVKEVADSFLTRVLAHEIDHTRDSDGGDHGDPSGKKAAEETGPAVDDANTVKMQLGSGGQRDQYVYEEDGDWFIDFTVDGQKVTLNLSELKEATEKADKDEDEGEDFIPLENQSHTQQIPRTPCEPGGSGDFCWTRADQNDADLDGVPNDGSDVCPQTVDPQQADSDGDGNGDACERDGDDDGLLDALENGLGASGMSPDATPEHWTLPGTCTDGTDNDRDGFADGDDQGCLSPPPVTDSFARLGPPFFGLPEQHHVDRGGLLPGTSAFPLSGTITLDPPDQDPFQVPVQGTVVTRRDPRDGPSGAGEVQTELVALRLEGTSTQIPVRVTLDPELTSEGRLQPATDGQPDLFSGAGAADSFFDVFLEIETDGTVLTNPSGTPLQLRSPEGSPLPHWPYGGDVLFDRLGDDRFPLVEDSRAGTRTTSGRTPSGHEGGSGWHLNSLDLSADPVSLREAGADRVETAVEVSRAQFLPGDTDTVLVATAANYPDALAGGPLARELDAPILLTDPDELSAATADEIRRLHASTAIVLGGEVAVSSAVADSLRDDLGVTVDRIDGLTRNHTAARIAGRLADGGVDTAQVYVTEGRDPDPSRGWPDAVAVSALASAQRRPILLVTTDALPERTRQALGDLGVRRATVVGGDVAVSKSVRDAIAAEIGNQPGRLFGSTRFGTSAAVADAALAGGLTADQVWLATGLAFPDALVAGPAAAKDGGVLLLVHGDDLDASRATRDWLTDHRTTTSVLRLLGGTVAIDNGVEQQARDEAFG